RPDRDPGGVVDGDIAARTVIHCLRIREGPFISRRNGGRQCNGLERWGRAAGPWGRLPACHGSGRLEACPTGRTSRSDHHFTLASAAPTGLISYSLDINEPELTAIRAPISRVARAGVTPGFRTCFLVPEPPGTFAHPSFLVRGRSPCPVPVRRPRAAASP